MVSLDNWVHGKEAVISIVREDWFVYAGRFKLRLVDEVKSEATIVAQFELLELIDTDLTSILYEDIDFNCRAGGYHLKHISEIMHELEDKKQKFTFMVADAKMFKYGDVGYIESCSNAFSGEDVFLNIVHNDPQ